MLCEASMVSWAGAMLALHAEQIGNGIKKIPGALKGKGCVSGHWAAEFKMVVRVVTVGLCGTPTEATKVDISNAVSTLTLCHTNYVDLSITPLAEVDLLGWC